MTQTPLEFLDVPFPPEPEKPYAEMSDREILLDNTERTRALNEWHVGVNHALVTMISKLEAASSAQGREKWVVRGFMLLGTLVTVVLHFIPGK